MSTTTDQRDELAKALKDAVKLLRKYKSFEDAQTHPRSMKDSTYQDTHDFLREWDTYVFMERWK